MDQSEPNTNTSDTFIPQQTTDGDPATQLDPCVTTVNLNLCSY